MPVFRAIVFAAALAGLLAGLFVTLAQQLGTVPLILEAEVFGQAAAAGTAPGHDHAGHEHGAAGQAEPGWAPRDGIERTAFTGLANILTATGFALLLVAGFALTGRSVGWREGLLWGLGGFIAFMLAPSLGLPPELPGMPAAELGPRQAWWGATALATAAGIGLLAFQRSPAATALAVLLLVAPHLIGAPQPAETATPVPDALARRFVVAATVTSFLFWALLGVACALLFQRLGQRRSTLSG